MIQAQTLQLWHSQEFIVVICLGLFVFGHFFNYIIEERAPFRSWPQLRYEERMLLLALVCSKYHTAILTPCNRIQVHSWLHTCPGFSVFLIPNLNNPFIRRKHFFLL